MITLAGSYRDWPLREAATWCTIGVFDGVHLGHQSILAALRSRAEDGIVGVITFREHPAHELYPGAAPPMLASLEQRLELFATTGVDIVAVLDFAEVRHLDPEHFVTEIIVGAMNATHVSVGVGFRFGYQMAGDEAALRRLGDEHGFDVEMLEIVGDPRPIRSTTIREALGEGKVADAAEMLGRPFQLRGGVVQGDQRGRQLGFPTANLEIESTRAIPGRGVYAAVTTTSNGTVHDSVVNVGVRPTFGGMGLVVEVHLLDASLDLYGQELSVDFIKRIRAERRFDGIDELTEQIARDVIAARGELVRYRE